MLGKWSTFLALILSFNIMIYDIFLDQKFAYSYVKESSSKLQNVIFCIKGFGSKFYQGWFTYLFICFVLKTGSCSAAQAFLEHTV